METEITKFELLEQKMIPGVDSRLGVEYYIETMSNGIKNKYKVFAKVHGLLEGSPYLIPTEYEPLTNNYETIIEDAVFDLFQQYVS